MAIKANTPEELLHRAYNLKDGSQAQDLYRDWASSYDETMLGGLSYLTPAKTASLLAEHLDDTDAEILDVGSGTGLAGLHLAHLGYRALHGLDFSSEMLAQAKLRLHNGKAIYQSLMEADLNQPLAIADGTYDALICTGTFTHAHVGAGCLPELFRILKPGGLFACTVHKDVWTQGGFKDQIEQLEENGIATTRVMEMDIYFETDDEPQGWYLVWEKHR